MKRSTDRIIVSHAGTLPRPDNLRELLQSAGLKSDVYRAALPAAVAQVVKQQVEVGIDCVNDGELSKSNFTNYVRDRLDGIESREFAPGTEPPSRNISGRDLVDFPQFFKAGLGGFGRGANAQPFGGPPPTGNVSRLMCTGPLKYIGHEEAAADIANIKAAMASYPDVEAYLPAIAPGTIEHWLWNEHYKDDEELLFAIADAVHDEYKAITDAGFALQIDDPDLPDGWQMYPGMSVADYRKYAELRVEALNHALRDCPVDRVRLHICWGSGHGPHKHDIDLKDIIDIVLKTNAECFSVEAANPRHEHEWAIWREIKLPEGKTYMPGVISHVTDHIEHPELVAQRLVQYANLMGRENVIAGTDCGVGSRVGNAEICWAKFDAMAEGARIATKQLWG